MYVVLPTQLTISLVDKKCIYKMYVVLPTQLTISSVDKKCIYKMYVVLPTHLTLSVQCTENGNLKCMSLYPHSYLYQFSVQEIDI